MAGVRRGEGRDRERVTALTVISVSTVVYYSCTRALATRHTGTYPRIASCIPTGYWRDVPAAEVLSALCGLQILRRSAQPQVHSAAPRIPVHPAQRTVQLLTTPYRRQRPSSALRVSTVLAGAVPTPNHAMHAGHRRHAPPPYDLVVLRVSTVGAAPAASLMGGMRVGVYD